jgi:predicted unusual protein kinase regulating ubiquinone biosynthesis (AarF/ABC1/UbiB family)
VNRRPSRRGFHLIQVEDLVFDPLKDKALSSGNSGQVFYAKLMPDDAEVVVKVQYLSRVE